MVTLDKGEKTPMDKFWGSFYMASQKAGLSSLHPQRCSLKSVPWRWVPFLCFSPSSYFHSCFLGLLPKSTNYLQAQLRLCFLGKPWLRFTPRLIPSGFFISDAHHLLTSLSVLPWRLWPQALPLHCHHCLCPSQQRGPNYRPRVTYCFDLLYLNGHQSTSASPLETDIILHSSISHLYTIHTYPPLCPVSSL